MNRMQNMTLNTDIVSQLEQLGLDSTQMKTVIEEIEHTKQPWYKRLWSKGTSQLSHIRGEAAETKRLTLLLTKGHNNLTSEEREEVRSQLWDLFKVIPAGLIAGGNAVLPIPGTSLFTPVLLAKAGLLPSRWREAHILHQLQEEERRLREIGQENLANEIHKLTEQVEDCADMRSQQAQDILHHWDANGNGIWDSTELEAYKLACLDTKSRLKSDGNQANWFIQQDDLIFGPTQANRVTLCNDSAWIRHYPSETAATKWVKISDVLHLETDDDAEPRP